MYVLYHGSIIKMSFKSQQMSDVFKEIYSDKKDNLSRAFTGNISYFQIFWII